MREYKLKFESNEQAVEILDSLIDKWESLPVIVDYEKFEYDIILSEESEILTPFEVFPTIVKHKFQEQ
jgi:hypothetical protein